MSTDATALVTARRDDARAGTTALAATAVFAVLFLFHTYPLGLGDIYWHLATGRWIVEHGALPQSDPFLYTLPATLDDRQRLLLQGYWLAQLLFYAVHQTGGDAALVALKGAIFVAIYYALWRIMILSGARSLFALLVLLPLPLLFYRYDELRPQLFSFLGTLLVYGCVVQGRAELRAGRRWPASLLALVPIMLVWANLHRGFILGAVVMAAALLGELYRYSLQCRFMERRALSRYVLVMGAALLASLLSPGHYHAYVVNLQELGGGVYSSVDEFLPLWSYARLFGQPWLFFVPLTLMTGAGALLVRRWYQAHPSQVLNLIGFSIAGLLSFRFMFLSVAMALAIGAPHASALLERHLARSRHALIVAVVAVALGMAALGWNRSALRVGTVERAYVPEGAARFVREQRPPAPLFSPYEYGGYLEWTLGDAYKLFYDQRSLEPAIYAEYARARDGRYADVFAKYGIKTVVFYLRAPVLGTIPPLVPALLNDPRWDIVYVDVQTLVATRSGAHAYATYDKARILEYLNSKS